MVSSESERFRTPFHALKFTKHENNHIEFVILGTIENRDLFEKFIKKLANDEAKQMLKNEKRIVVESFTFHALF